MEAGFQGPPFLMRRPWRQARVPQEVRAVPTMLSEHEQALLYSLARDYASDGGAIVDAGCFLGGSSAALLAGLRDRASRWAGPPLVSYDLFRVEDYAVSQFFSDGALATGESFRPLYDGNVSGFGVPHEVREGDITTFGWSGGPIDVLFLDVLKTWEINDAVLRDFLPHAIPGRTVIVHQDYEWGHTPWLHITVELMRDSLRWIDAVPHCTHVFLLERPIPDEILNMSVLRDLDDDRKIQLMDQAIAHNEGDARAMVELSKVVLLAGLHWFPAAWDLLESVTERCESPSVKACGQYIRTALPLQQAGLELLRLPADSIGSELDPLTLPEVGGDEAAEAIVPLRQAIAAVGEADGERIRAVLSPEFQHHIAAADRRVSGESRTCGEVLSALFGKLPPERRKGVADGEVVQVRLQGDRGFVICRFPAVGLRAMRMQREADGWKLTDLVGSPLKGS